MMKQAQDDWKNMNEATPKFEMEKTKYGFKEVAVRDLNDGSSYFRLRHAALLFFSLVAFQHGAPMMAIASIPINDHCNAQWFFIYNTQDNILNIIEAADTGDEMSPVLRNYNNFTEGLGSVENLWHQDREFMKTHWSGIKGPLPWEDVVVVESMGPIVDRTLENLGASDVIIIKTRRYILNMLKQMQKGETAEIDGYLVDNLADLRGVAFNASSDIDWREVDGKMPPGYTI